MKMKDRLKLTSVNIIKENYYKFKDITVNTDMTLQKLVNRTMDLYNKDEDFRNKVDNHQTIEVKNSKF
jgi:hypothetical protein